MAFIEHSSSLRTAALEGQFIVVVSSGAQEESGIDYSLQTPS